MQVEQFLLDLHTGRPLTESDYTRCCINTNDLLMMSMCLLETCRGLKYTYYIKELFVKLVTYQKLFHTLLLQFSQILLCTFYSLVVVVGPV